MLPGLYAEAEIALEHKEDVPTVPIQALSHEGEKTSVFVVDPNGELEERKVQLGLQTASDAEILSGVKRRRAGSGERSQRLEAGEKACVRRWCGNAIPGGERAVNKRSP